MKTLLQLRATSVPVIGRATAALRRLLWQPRPLRTQLIVLTLASALPITAFSGILLWRLHNRDVAQFEERLRLTAQDLAGDIDRQLEAMIVTLRTLATSRALKRSDLAEFHTQAREAIAGSRFAVLLARPDGIQLLNTRVEYGGPLPTMSDVETLAKTVSSARHQVSNLFMGNVTKKPQLNVHMPVLEDGVVRYVLLLAFEPVLIRDISKQQHLSKEWVRGVFDGNLRLIARTEQHEQFVYTVMPESSGLRRQGTQVFRTMGLTGKPVLRALADVKNADWIVGATVDEAFVNATTIEASKSLAVVGMFLIGLVAALARIISNGLSQEIRDLAGAAEKLDKGARLAPSEGLVIEVNEVKRSLAAAAARRLDHEAERDLLVRELSHRVKNSFAVLQSILNATLRTTADPKAFAENFKGRLHSMAAAQDILTNNDWRNADLETLAHGQLAAYMQLDHPCINISGPRVLLPSEFAVPIGLILHELGTNAAKHGALSTPNGRVRLSWVVVDGDDTQELQIEWREVGGPKVQAPERKGFGSTLIERGLATAQVERHFEPDGVVCRIAVSLRSAPTGK
jgi:two-component sensor histidine kinase